MPILGEAWLKAYDTQQQDNFSQAGALYRVMVDEQKDILAQNIATGLVLVTQSAQKRMLGYFAEADPDYAERIEKAMATVE